MAATVKGRGIIWSTGAIVGTAGIVSSTSGSFMQSVSIERTSERTHVKDNGGTIRSSIFHGAMKNLRLTVIPCAISGTNTIANAQSSGDGHTIAAGTKVSFTDDSGTIIDDDYNVLSATQNRTVDGVATVDLVLEASDEGIDLETTVS
jgi:hypothetical protein